jgi:hypothetical protein
LLSTPWILPQLKAVPTNHSHGPDWSFWGKNGNIISTNRPHDANTAGISTVIVGTGFNAMAPGFFDNRPPY